MKGVSEGRDGGWKDERNVKREIYNYMQTTERRKEGGVMDNTLGNNNIELLSIAAREEEGEVIREKELEGQRCEWKKEGRRRKKRREGWRKVVHIYNSIQIAVTNEQPTCHCAKQLCLLNYSEQCPSVRLFQHGWRGDRGRWVAVWESWAVVRVVFEGRHLSGKETKMTEVELHENHT